MSSNPKLRQNSKTFFKFVWPLIKAPNFFAQAAIKLHFMPSRSTHLQKF